MEGRTLAGKSDVILVQDILIGLTNTGFASHCNPCSVAFRREQVNHILQIVQLVLKMGSFWYNIYGKGSLS